MDKNGSLVVADCATGNCTSCTNHCSDDYGGKKVVNELSGNLVAGDCADGDCTSCNNHCSDDYAGKGVLVELSKFRKPILGGILSENFSLQPGQRMVLFAKSKQPITLTTQDMEAVFAYENPLFIAKCCKKFGISEDIAKEKFAELKKFLILCAVSKDAISPSKEMDEMWHEFILFTRDYYNFCVTFFGKMVHHQPEVITNKDQLSNAQNRYGESRNKALELFKGDLDLAMRPSA